MDRRKDIEIGGQTEVNWGQCGQCGQAGLKQVTLVQWGQLGSPPWHNLLLIHHGVGGWLVVEAT